MVAELRARVLRGQPLDGIDIIDCHCHIGPYHGFFMPAGDADDMLRTMDLVGIDMACITAHAAAVGPDFQAGNDLVAATVSAHPRRFVGYVTVNPNHADGTTDELERCLSLPGMRAIKLHPSDHGRAIDDSAYDGVYRRADDEQRVVLVHTWGAADVTAVAAVAGRYPRARIIMGHAAAEPVAMAGAAGLARERRNVYVDLALSRAYQGNVEWLARVAGADNVVYGSDMPFFDPRPTVGRVALAELEEPALRAIFGGTMRELLGLTR